MPHINRGADQGQHIIVLPDAYTDTAERWERAKEIDPDRTDWAEVVSIEPTDHELSRVTLAVSPERYRTFAEGRTEDDHIVAAIGAEFEHETWEIIQQGHQHGVVEHALRDPDLSYFGAQTIVVTWPVIDAFSIITIIGNGEGDVACIELTRLGPMGRRSVTVAVSLPKSMFDGVISKCVQDANRPVAECVYEAIAEAAYGVRDHGPPSPVSHDEIPF